MLHGFVPESRFLPYLSWPQVDTLDKRGDAVVVLPAGAIEQHGLHLPCAVDSMIASAVVGGALSLLEEDIKAYALPAITYGKSEEHIHFPGTITLTGELLLQTVIEIGESIYRSGFRKLLIVNAHGGQPQVLDIAARELRLRHGDFLIIARSVWSVAYDNEFLSEEEKRLAMHAGHAETALLLALAPNLVNMDLAVKNVPEVFPCPSLSKDRPALAWCARDFGESGVIGDPRHASAEQGRALLSDLTRSWATGICEFYELRWSVRKMQSWGRNNFCGDVQKYQENS
ncbi:creatininase family protein [Acidithiobacillus sp.]|jgi:creatinine amidohydrolase|uniref:creatininase family protein n=1 Tax=Acidithiobacillus sp. TaxID=1872118 RepID=UPI0032B000ED